jgi:hypothetical protein
MSPLHAVLSNSKSPQGQHRQDERMDAHSSRMAGPAFVPKKREHCYIQLNCVTPVKGFSSEKRENLAIGFEPSQDIVRPTKQSMKRRKCTCAALTPTSANTRANDVLCLCQSSGRTKIGKEELIRGPLIMSSTWSNFVWPKPRIPGFLNRDMQTRLGRSLRRASRAKGPGVVVDVYRLLSLSCCSHVHLAPI